MRSTRALVSAAIQRISRGTSVPGPRTSRSMSPRLTVSSHRLERATPGAAGCSDASAQPTSTTAIVAAVR